MSQLNKSSVKKSKQLLLAEKQGHKRNGSPQTPVQHQITASTRGPKQHCSDSQDSDEYLPAVTLISPTGVRCISVGTSHQGAQKSGHAMQCVVMSTCAAIYSIVKNRQIFTTDDIDTILRVGDSIYSNIITQKYNNQAVLLNPEDDLPKTININEYNIDFHVEWVNNGLYPTTKSELIQLKGAVFHDLVHNNNTAYLFTGQSATVSFWQNNGKFYLFNSHAIDSTGKRNMSNDNLNKARLFELDNLYELIKLLFVNVEYKNNLIKGENNEEFMLTKIEVKETYTPALIPTQSSNIEWIIDEDTNIDITTSLSILNVNEMSTVHDKITDDIIMSSLSETTSEEILIVDEKLTLLKPVVLIEKLTNDDFNEPKSNKKRGRPIKKKRGPPKTVENAHLKASKKYNEKKKEVHRAAAKKYSQNNPKININAVKKYTEKRPEVHREAAQRYSQLHPEINNAAVRQYYEKNSENTIAAVNQYKATHKDKIRVSNKIYNQTVRNVEPALRGSTLIAQRQGLELNAIQTYTLKKPDLTARDTYTCPHCKAKLFEEERSGKEWCCGTGRYNIIHFGSIDESFYSDPEFRKYARAYNNLFSFSALGVSKGFQHAQTGFGFIKIQGRTYHQIFDLSCNRPGSINHIGLYIDDGEERKRLADDKNLSRMILAEISLFLENVNPFIDCFKRLSAEPSDEAFLMFQRTSRTTHGNILGDMPDGREVAAILCTDRDQYTPKCIAVWKQGAAKPHTIPMLHPLYEALQYPLLYPYGEEGWTTNKLDNKGHKISQTKYYRCLMLSEPRFNSMGRLNDEWACDMYSRTEEERLAYIANRQKNTIESNLRTAPLDELLRQINDDETIMGEGGTVAGRIYLPCTFTGSPRYMKLKYLDAMAVVARLGGPSYFITFTCNLRWPEIQNATPQYSPPSPITCARVFKLKLQELLRDVRNGHYFGECIYILYVIEFQKRGLPHAHIAFRVEGGGPVQNLDIDKVIRADIPSEDEDDGTLRKFVLGHMIHGPCGTGHRTDLPCWDTDKKKCSKRFPKQPTDTTHTDDRGFINLKRNPDNRATIKYRNRNVEVSDSWVVPYNAAILKKYNCHLNIEPVSTRFVLKYLFKYMTKGSDETRVAVVPDNEKDNEVEQYVTKRYLGACEAVWRIFEFDITGREPNVKQLAVHLEGRQSIFYRQGEEFSAIEKACSDLVKYFNRPTEPEFDHLTYMEFYEQYIVHNTRPTMKNVPIYEILNGKYFVTKRQRKELVARLFWVSPNRGEQFYLRLLLSNFPCRGYDDLLKLHGDNNTTFQETCRALGIADDELEYEIALEEAATFYTGRSLRHFFVLITTNGAPAAILWDKYKHLLSEDHLERNPGNPDEAYRLALLEIDRLLRKHGSSLADQGLPVIQDDTTEFNREHAAYQTEDLQTYVDRWLPLLSSEQRQVFDHINALLHPSVNYGFVNDSNVVAEQTAIFLDGPSGTGKTLLLNVITAYVRSCLGGVVLCTAYSGIAATNYEGGFTAHSMFRLPLDVKDDSGIWGLTNGSQRAELIYRSHVIIIDEAPMMHKYLIQLLDRSLRDLMRSDRLFGGKIIILAGDFRQIPPVVPSARNNYDIVQASLKTSTVWPKLYKMSLKNAQRTRGDQSYSDFILKLGSGECDSIEMGTEKNKLTLVSLAHLNVVLDLHELLDFVFPVDILHESDVCAKRAIMSTHNVNVNEINNMIMEKLPGNVIHCYSVDKIDGELSNEFHLGIDTLNRVQARGVPDHDLQVKVGAVCMIIRNLSFVDGLVNGTKVIIVDMLSPRIIKVRKPNENQIHCIPRITFKTPIQMGSPIEMYRHQFPLQICYAMTVHKSQGQTIEKVGVDIRSDVFSHGQLYVALGRVRTKQNICILIKKERINDNVPYANNVVIRELIN